MSTHEHQKATVDDLGPLVLRTVSVGPMDNNAYLLTCRATGAQLLVDAAAEPDRLLSMVRDGAESGELAAILTTHPHHDHVGALADMVTDTGAETLAGAPDVADIPVPTDRALGDGDRVEIGDLEFSVIALRGHTPGSIALLWRGGEAGDHLLTGDSLFPGGVGNTGGDPARFTQLIDDVEQRVFAVLPDATRVYPGHGAGTTLGAERGRLPEWRERGW